MSADRRAGPGVAFLFIICAFVGAVALIHAAPEIGTYGSAVTWWRPAVCTTGGVLFGVLVASIYAYHPAARPIRPAILAGMAIGVSVGASLSIRWINLVAELTAGGSPMLTASATTGALVVVGLAWAVGGAALGLLFGLLTQSREERKAAFGDNARNLAAHATFAVVVIGGLAAFPGRAELALVEWLPDIRRPSLFLARDRQMFAAMLEGTKSEVLVVPFGARGPSIDRPARSLMTRYLARHLFRVSSASISDPTLVARALGATEREIPAERVQRLADALGAHTVVTGAVTRPGGAFKLDAEIEVRKRGADGAFHTVARRPISGIGFDDENPPEEAFRVRLDEVGALGLPPRTAVPDGTDGDDIAADLPLAPEGLVRGPQPPALERTVRLQWLAATYAVPDLIPAQHLWERSLVALLDAPSENANTRLLRARANFWLGRRPYALKLLGNPETPEARALHAFLMGNLYESAGHAAGIKNTSLAQIARLEVEDLRYYFWKFEQSQERLAAELEARPAYAAWHFRAFSRDQWFAHAARATIAQALAARGVAIERMDYGWRDWAILWIRYLLGLGVDEPDSMAAHLEKARAPLWKNRGAEWAVSPAGAALAEWDLYDALFATSLESLAWDIESVLTRQGRPEAARRYAESLDGVFAGAPVISVAHARALKRMAEETTGDRSLAYGIRASRTARDVIGWEGGESRAESNARYVLLTRAEAPDYQDEPMRDFRQAPAGADDRYATTRIDAKNLEARLAQYRRSLAHTHHQHWYLEQGHQILLTLGRPEEAAALRAENADRFKGSARRDEFIARHRQRLPAREGAAGQETPEAALTRLLEAEPRNWENYVRLAREQLFAGKPEAARDTLHKYPEFTDPGAHPVAVSNHAFEGGRLLYRSGELQLGEPLLGASVRARTGAASEMWAASYLARSRGDYGSASAHLERLFNRYRNHWSAADAATFAFMAGDAERGWKLIEAGAKQSTIAVQLAIAAINGHRIAGATPQQLRDWTAAARLSEHSDHARTMMREAVVLLGLFVDRAPTEDDLRLAEPFLGKSGDRAFVLLARGLLALQRKEYPQAAKMLDELHQSLVNVSLNRRESYAYTWPYVTLAHVKTGDAAQVRQQIERYRAGLGREYYTLLAEAIIEGLDGRHDQALAALKRAFYSPSTVELKPLEPEWQLLETCELLFAESGQAAYRELLVDLARRLSRGYPFPYAFAFLAKYSQDREERLAALGNAVYLDRNSARIKDARPEELRQARERFEQERPFRPRQK